MRLLLFIAVLMVAVPAFAQTPIDKDTANAYYGNCMKQETPLMGQESKEIMCACTSAKMMENMSVEDVQAMQGSDGSARLAFNKMLISVYGPCMRYPAYDYHYLTCVENPDTAKLSANPEELCSCMASEVAEYLGSNGVNVLADILQRNPNIEDPMSALMEDESFQAYAQNKLLDCYAENK
jgi:hypothetical protein